MIVLAGTNYAVKQARGKFGLGAKMALIWSKMSTGCPVQVHTAKKGKKLTFCRLDIDIVANRPHVLEHTELPNPDGTIGTEISVIIEGSWTSYRVGDYVNEADGYIMFEYIRCTRTLRPRF